jgi:leader peptidase (prepilin peptidase)/N-methyltransferase
MVYPLALLLCGMIMAWALPRLAWLLPAWEAHLNEEPGDDELARPRLFRRRWRCQDCHAVLPWAAELPLLGWFAMKGRCPACGHGWPPILAAMSALAVALPWIVAWRHGLGPQALVLLPLVYGFAAMAVVDQHHCHIPQTLSDPLLMIGLAVSATGIWIPAEDAALGAAAAFAALGGVSLGVRLFSGRDGMGYGDVMAGAALGAWLGAGAELMVAMLVAFAFGALVNLGARALGRQPPERIPLGPYLALGMFVAILSPAGEWLVF